MRFSFLFFFLEDALGLYYFYVYFVRTMEELSVEVSGFAIFVSFCFLV